MTTLFQRFKDGIQLLDIDTNDATNSSLLFVSDIHSNQQFSPKELFSLEAAELYEADAVYFRRFDDGRLPIPQIYIYDNTSGKYDSKKYAEIHRNLWSSCIIPLFVIIEITQVKIFDSRDKVKIDGDEIYTDPIETIQFTAAAIKKFSAKFLDNGTFWELSQNQNKFLASTSAYNDLIEGLKGIRRKFLEVSKLPEITAHKILVLGILIKYLEERGDEGGSIFAQNFFKQFGANDFCGVLRIKGKIAELYEKLSSHFNGRIFEWNDNKEIALLKATDLTILADYLDGNVKNSQYVLWRLYAFNHLPVELISNVYEEFLGKDKKGIVYTPHFLVNLLVDECMPISEPKNNFKIIDPACGSGIFLVVAFKRLVQWKRYQTYLKTGKLQHLNSKELLQILMNSIYGVDKEEDATRLTVFSLALALCDMLSPKEIWTELKFEDLTEKNINSKDFFYFIKNQPQDFDLVIGNPPFDELTKAQFDKLVQENNIQLDYRIPQNQLALLFLKQAIKLLKKGGLLSLIMPSGPLLYNDTLDFRRSFFSKYNVLQILDLTNLRRILFEKADVPTAIIFVEANTPGEDQKIMHIIVSKTKSAKERIYFEIDHYDFNEVTKEEALNSEFVWKSNLIGGKRLFYLVNRLSQLRSVGDYLNGNKSKGWHVQEGFIIGESSKKSKADFLTGKRHVPTEAFTEDGIDESKIEIIQQRYFASPRIPEIYMPPLILLKENIGEKKLPLYFSSKFLAYKDKIVGIAAPKRDIDELRSLYQTLQKRNDLFRLYIAATSNQLFINKNTAILKQDLMAIPYPENSSELNLSFAEKIIRDDVLKYSFEYLRRNDNKITREVATENNLTSFSDVFCKALNSIYSQNGKSFQLSQIIESDTWIACDFKYSNKELAYKHVSSQKAEDNLSAIIENGLRKNIRINRILRYYTKNNLILIKPKQLRYWLKSSALRDADDSLQDLIKAGY